MFWIQWFHWNIFRQLGVKKSYSKKEIILKKSFKILFSSVAFFVSFVYLYKKTGKFRKSLFSVLPIIIEPFNLSDVSYAKDADVFTPQNQVNRTRSNSSSRSFNSQSNSNDGSGPGKPSDGDNNINDDDRWRVITSITLLNYFIFNLHAHYTL